MEERVNTQYSLTLVQPQAFSTNISNMPQLMELSYEGIENIVGKEENAGYQHFLLFQLCFQKASFQYSLKLRIVW